MTFLVAEPLTLMISNRCTDKVAFDGRPQPMAAVRRAMKEALEAIRSVSGDPDRAGQSR